MSFTSAILASAKVAHVPASLLLAICTHESQLHNVIVPHDGDSASYGICQIKADTAREMGYAGVVYRGKLVRSKVFSNSLTPANKVNGLMDPFINSFFAALYLKKQLDRYDGDWCKAVAAYNSGTYHDSKRFPGKPRNFKYVKKVVLYLDDEHKDMLVCGERKINE